MRRTYSLLLICCLAVVGMAQTQQGMVKTKGRMINGKHVAGQGISGATVSIQGRNAVQSQSSGAFSFPIPSKTFMLQGVQKNGYQLVDADATRKAYQYSPNIFYIVMETPDQQKDDELAAARKIRRTLQQQLQQREEELEELKAQNKLTQEEYRKTLAKLYDDQQNNEKLIADMAKEYAQMDYDQMDELNRQINEAILNGDLMKADSLLHIKGDINSRIVEVRKAQQAEKKEEADLIRRQTNLAASKEGTQKKLVNIAHDCKSYFERYKLANQYDSATYYIELRAELDTTNIKWQYDAGYYCFEQRMHQKAIKYYIRALDIVRGRTDDNINSDYTRACLLNNLANVYTDCQWFTESEAMHREALEIFRHLVIDNSQDYEADVAWTLNDLAYLSYVNKRFAESEAMHKEALEIYRRLAAKDPQKYELSIANTLSEIADLYTSVILSWDGLDRIDETESYYKSALSIYRRYASSNPLTYEPSVISCLRSLSTLYSQINRRAEADSLLVSVIESYRHLVSLNPKAYEPSLASTLLVFIYNKTPMRSGEVCREALEIYTRLAEDNPDVYEVSLAIAKEYMGDYCYSIKDTLEAEKYYLTAMDTFRHYESKNIKAYENNVIILLSRLISFYTSINRFDEAEKVYQSELELRKQIANTNFEEYGVYWAKILRDIGHFYERSEYYVEAEEMYMQEQEIYQRLANENSEYEHDIALVKLRLGRLYLVTKQYSKGENAYLSCLNIYQHCADSAHGNYLIDIYNVLDNVVRLYTQSQQLRKIENIYLSMMNYMKEQLNNNIVDAEQYIARIENNLADFYYENHRRNDAEQMYLTSLDIFRRFAETYPEDNNPHIASTLGKMSFNSIFLKHYADAERYAREGLKIDSTKHWISSNLAAALLFQGEYVDAEEIYRQYKDELKDSFLDDFRQFAEAGVIPPKCEADVEKIKQMLEE